MCRFRLPRVIALWFLAGSFCFVVEGLLRAFLGGYAGVYRVAAGGVCGAVVGVVNQWPRFARMKTFWRVLLGMLAALCAELALGWALNIRLGLRLWDYGNRPYNVLGQVAPLSALLWIVFVPFGIWLEDAARRALWSD